VGLIVLLFLIASSAPVKGQTNGPSSIVNGGFDTGNFNNWTLGGAASITNGRGHITYATIVDNGSTWDISPHSAPYAAYLATFGSPGYLSQSVPTLAGAMNNLTISFWVNNSWEDQNVFVVSFNGTTIFGATNLIADGWINIQTNISFVGPPNGSSVLQFTFEDDDGDALGLDDVSVTAVVTGPPPAPTNLVAVAGYEQVALSWAPSAGATLYFVKRSTTSGAETNICILYATNYTDTGLADGTKYYYVVTAANLWVGGASSEVSATTAPPVAIGGVAYADSSDFTLNTGGTLAGLAGVAFADSSDFTLNTGGTLPGLAGVAFADSSDFTLNTGGTLAGLAGVAFADSSDFTLNTGGALAGLAGVAFADSTDFALNTGGALAGMAGVAFADSSDFTLNTLNSVAIGPPHFTSISVSGRTLTLNATNGTPGGQYTLLGSTNLASSLWTTILTGNFDSSGTLNLTATNLINPATPQQFYMLRQ
jgi:hypothetical protein